MKDNNLQEVFDIQKKFTEKLFLEKYHVDMNSLSKEERIKWSKEYILCCTKELYEMLDELNWKTHRYINREDNLDNFAEEGIGAFKFLLNLFIINGFDSDFFYTKFIEKSIVVDIKFEQEKQLQSVINSGNQYVVFDIDGILNDYPNNVVRYFKYLGYEYNSIQEFKDSDIKKYNEVKNKFRVSGEERNCKMIVDGLNAINKAKQKGYGVILLTSRPYHKITRLFYDTIQWLSDCKINYDFLFFAKDKENYLIQNFNSKNIEFVIDDQIDNVNKLCNTFKTYLLFNEGLYSIEDLTQVNKKVNIITDLKQLEL